MGAVERAGLTDLIAEAAKGYSLIVVDTLSRAFGRADQMDNADMTMLMSALQRVAIRYDLALLLIDHHRKAGAASLADPIDDIMGSTAKAGVVDAAMGLYKQRGELDAVLKITGRDICERELPLHWDGASFKWTCQAAVPENDCSARQREVLDMLKFLGKAQVRELAEATGQDRGNLFRRCAEHAAERTCAARGGRRPCLFSRRVTRVRAIRLRRCLPSLGGTPSSSGRAPSMAASTRGHARFAARVRIGFMCGRNAVAGLAWAPNMVAPAVGDRAISFNTSASVTASGIARRAHGWGLRSTTSRRARRAPVMLSNAYVAPLAPPNAAWQARGRQWVDECAVRLWQPEGAPALEYLHRRALHDDTLRTYHIGFHPSNRYEPRRLWGLGTRRRTKGAAACGCRVAL